MIATEELSLEELLGAVRACRACEGLLPLGPRPVLQAGRNARVLLVGQAPGLNVHRTGIPWNDPSGERLREWLELDPATFYDSDRLAIIPMGYCYPGKGPSGDLPPRRECAELWLDALLDRLPHIEMTLLVGAHAQRHFLGRRAGSLTQTVRNWRDYAPACFPLPHPSPRNRGWLKRNPWFEADLLPTLRERLHRVLGS